MSASRTLKARCPAGAMAGLALAALLAGCACPPYRAAWYAVETDTSDSKKTPEIQIQLALLNEGTRKLTLTQLRVNPDRSEGLFRTGGGLELGSVTLQPGQLHIINFTAAWRSKNPEELPAAVCMLPVQIQASCSGWCPPQRVSGTLPNYLRTEWLEHCRAPANETQAGTTPAAPAPSASSASSSSSSPAGVQTP